MLLPVLDILNSKRIILASASVMRQRILTQIGLKFEVSPGTFAEDLPHSDFESSMDYVIKTSEMKLRLKLEDLKEKQEKVDILITADSIATVDEREIIEKPESEEHAFKIWKSYLANGSSQIQTSVWIAFLNRDTLEIERLENLLEKSYIFYDQTTTDETIQRFVQTGEPFGKAGGICSEGLGGSLLKKIEGCYFNVQGFPSHTFAKKLVQMINEQQQS